MYVHGLFYTVYLKGIISNLDFILWISQTLFSTSLILNVIKLIIFKRKCECVYDEIYIIFLDRDEISTI